jgi:hypothetical protein
MRAFFLATEKVPNPTIVTFRPFFSEALMPARRELKAASACDLVSPTSFAIFPTRSPLFKEPPLSAPHFIRLLGIGRVIAPHSRASQAKFSPPLPLNCIHALLGAASHTRMAHRIKHEKAIT